MTQLQSPGLPFTDAAQLAAAIPVQKAATFSDDGECRFTLTRIWGDGPRLLICGANPSTAGGETDDPTSLAWIHFGRLWGYGSYVAVNPLPKRSSTPKVAQQWYMSRLFGDSTVSATLARNFEIIAEESAKADLHVASWGNLIDDAALIEQTVKAIGRPLYCFGTTKDGKPKHVLARGPHRVPRDQQPILWRAA